MSYGQKKISARRCGRVLAIISLKSGSSKWQQQEGIAQEYIVELEDYIPEFSLVPDKIRQQAITFASELITAVTENRKELIQLISKYTKNRSWDKLYPIDQALLLVGAHSLELDIPSLMIKEILISSDILENNHAAPYLSGILKSIADGKGGSPSKIAYNKNMKIHLKGSPKRKGE